MTKHNHVTRYNKPLGQCPACDEYHNKYYLKEAYEKLQQENERLKKALEVSEGALMYMTEDYDCDPEDVALYDRKKTLEALAQIKKIKQGE